MNFFESLGDGWTIYLWLIIGAMIIAACVYWIRWAAKNEQFDEDIKYLVFDEGDKDKMTPAEFAKSRFPKSNILIPLDNAAEFPAAGCVILCGKNYQSAQRFPDCEQYWLLPEGAPPGKYPAGLKKIYLSRYDEAGYNTQWQSRAGQAEHFIEEAH